MLITKYAIFWIESFQLINGISFYCLFILKFLILNIKIKQLLKTKEYE